MTIITQNLKPVKQNLRIGERILKNFQSEYPYVVSSTKMGLKINKYKDNEKYTPIIDKLGNKIKYYILKILEIRMHAERIENPVEYLKEAVKVKKASNCGECVAIIADKLKSEKIEYKNIIMSINKKDTFEKRANHAFSVIGMNKNADVSKPKTWGKNAVIIDAWANTVTRAQEGLEYIKQILKVDSNKDLCSYRSYNYYI